jgi:uncharacterized membrane protein YhhN
MLAIVAALLAAVLDVALAALGWDGARVLTKPLPALILAGYAYAVPRRGSRLLAGGLVLAALGDEVLLRPGSVPFLAGMLAFVGMHVSYIAAYWSIGGERRTPPAIPFIGTLYLVAVMAVNWMLYRDAGAFAIPLLAYSIVLVTMAICALDTIGRIPFWFALAIAAGGAVFMLSDTTLAFEMFYPSFSLDPRVAEVLIVGTYFAAQLKIAWGLVSYERSRLTAS